MTVHSKKSELLKFKKNFFFHTNQFLEKSILLKKQILVKNQKNSWFDKIHLKCCPIDGWFLKETK